MLVLVFLFFFLLQITVCSEIFMKCYYMWPQLTNWRTAKQECWSRNLHLVSISSFAELRFVKYLLREVLFVDDNRISESESRPFNATYFTHIGNFLLCFIQCSVL